MLLFELFQHDPEFVEIREGDTLFQEGDPADVMYVLIEGEAEVSIGGGIFWRMQGRGHSGRNGGDRCFSTPRHHYRARALQIRSP